MKTFILFAILIVAAVIGMKYLESKSKGKNKEKGTSYKKIGFLFTEAEYSFYRILELALKDDYKIFGKVRVADVITPEQCEFKKWQIAFNKISAKHFDYVLCDKETLTPLAAIELDDKSHENEKRVKRDQFLENACKTADFKLIRVKATRNYNVEAVSKAIRKALEPVGTEKLKQEEKPKAITRKEIKTTTTA